MSIVGTRPPLISETNLYEPRHNRASNMILNECDLVISVGARLGLRQIGHMPELFAPNAKLISLLRIAFTSQEKLQLNNEGKIDKD